MKYEMSPINNLTGLYEFEFIWTYSPCTADAALWYLHVQHHCASWHGVLHLGRRKDTYYSADQYTPSSGHAALTITLGRNMLIICIWPVLWVVLSVHHNCMQDCYLLLWWCSLRQLAAVSGSFSPTKWAASWTDLSPFPLNCLTKSYTQNGILLQSHFWIDII